MTERIYRMRILSLVLAVAVLSVFAGYSKKGGAFYAKVCHFFSPLQEEKIWPVIEHKPFVVIVPSYNNSQWVEKNLRSIFEQKYDNYRVVYIDDASSDSTLEQAKAFVSLSGQSHRTQILHNEKNRGAMQNVYFGVHGADPDEIALVLDGDDWFAHDRVFEKLNEIYADPDVWATWGSYVEYPGYKTEHVANFARPIPLSVTLKGTIRNYSKKHWSFSQLRTFYVNLFHRIALKDLCYEDRFVDATHDVAYFIPLMEMAGKHARYLSDVLYIWNRDTPLNDDKVRGKRQLAIADEIYRRTPYFPVEDLFEVRPELEKKVDFILFSYDRPLQLYALLESIEKHASSIDQITVIYRCSSEEYEKAYREVGADFPRVKMVCQGREPAKDFQPLVMQALRSGSSEYFLFAVDDMVVIDRFDVREGIDALERTGAYGFFYRLGKGIDYDYMLDLSIRQPDFMRIQEDVYAWVFKSHQGYWGYPTSTDIVLYRKDQVLGQLEKLKFENPNQLEGRWLKAADFKGIGLCHSAAKVVNIPLNLVNISTNRCLNTLNPQELLEVFNRSLKIDIDPLYLQEYRSAHIDYTPSFIPRKKRI
ncbi:MAG: glycosyltransferase family 2 protein [Chlamydiales bacterium]|nr:glycosyltransferase family 2 protein [Chlamydiales bacterium]